jgi:hypothetical protein
MTNDDIQVAESAINSGDIELAKSLLNRMVDGNKFFIESLISISQSDIESALNSLEKCINAVRSPKSRDAILEARAKMIRGLARTSIGEITEGGADLRWAMDRLGAISAGSDEHGISILNVAAWHRQQSEIVMSLATHSEIARESTHSPEIVAISRQRVASIHAELEDYVGALRHYWTAWKLSVSSGIDAIAEVSCLHILDIGLTEVIESSLRLDEQVENAKPRSKSEKSSASIHPDDLLEALNWITPRSLEDISQNHRPDLSLIIESHNILNIRLPDRLTDNINLIQDPDVAKLLQ